MNFAIYSFIGETLTGGINKSYRKGIASIVALNKKEILRLSEDPELFKINYTDADRLALANFRIEAFTVAGVMSYELEQKLKNLALELQEGKHPLAKGEKNIKKVWVDEAHNIMADYIPIPDMPPPRYLNTNLRTAMQSSYHAAQYIRLQDDSVRDLYPAYQYKTLADSRVREEHRRLHDTIWRNNDPVWDKIWPPNGWNCRCYVKPLNQEEVNNAAVQPVNAPEQVDAVVKEGRIGKDFQRNPGQVRSIWGKWLQAKLKGKDYENMTNEIVKAGYSMPKWEKIEPLLKEAAVDEPDSIEYTKENFEKLFGKLPGKVVTVLGEFKFGEIFFTKLEKKSRESALPFINETMENPHLVFVDKDNGTLFVKAFKATDGKIFYTGILKQIGEDNVVISFHDKRNMNNKVNEGKFMVYQSLIRASGNAWGLPQFTHDAGRVNYTKLMFSDNLKNIKIVDGTLDEKEVRDITNASNEIWADTYNHNGIVNSEMNCIRYRVEGFQLVKVNNSIAYELKFYDYSRIDDYRKGVIIK